MMRLWLDSYARPTPMGSGAVIAAASVGLHVLLIGAAIVGTAPAPGAADDSRFALANRVYYIPPPDRAAAQSGTRETIRFVALSPVGLGAGFGPATIDSRKPVAMDPTPLPGNTFHDSITAPPIPRMYGEDTVFTVLEVDSAVVRSESSAAPGYPPELLSKGVTGSVKARYIVDTTGYADTATFQVVRATDPGFVTAVRAALPFMRFSPAKIGPRKVAQLVEQEFTFKISIPKDTVITAKRKPVG